MTLEDGTRTAPAKIEKLHETQTNAWYEVSLHQGRNQQVRRMFELVGHSVLKLRRVRIGFLTDEKLKPGRWRLLSPAEVSRLMKTNRKLATDNTDAFLWRWRKTLLKTSHYAF